MTVTAETLETQETRKAGHKGLAFFLPRLVVSTEIYELQTEALLLAGEIAKMEKAGFNDAIEVPKKKLEWALLGIKESIAASRGDIAIRIASGMPRYSGFEKVVSDFGVGEIEGAPAVRIPSTEITGVGTLPMAYTKHDPHPVIDMRIRTSFDEPTLIYEGPARIVAQESDGRWHRLPLEGIELGEVVEG